MTDTPGDAALRRVMREVVDVLGRFLNQDLIIGSHNRVNLVALVRTAEAALEANTRHTPEGWKALPKRLADYLAQVRLRHEPIIIDDDQGPFLHPDDADRIAEAAHEWHVPHILGSRLTLPPPEAAPQSGAPDAPPAVEHCACCNGYGWEGDKTMYDCPGIQAAPPAVSAEERHLFEEAARSHDTLAEKADALGSEMESEARACRRIAAAIRALLARTEARPKAAQERYCVRRQCGHAESIHTPECHGEHVRDLEAQNDAPCQCPGFVAPKAAQGEGR